MHEIVERSAQELSELVVPAGSIVLTGSLAADAPCYKRHDGTIVYPILSPSQINPTSIGAATAADITAAINALLATIVTNAQKGVANGVATLGADSKIPTAQMPSLTKSDVGLGNVDNTSDTSKPVSTAQQTAINGRVPTTRTVNGKALSADVAIDKNDVGLGNVDNTSDANKPVSTATQAALNAKQPVSYAVLANGTLAMGFGTTNTVKVTPTATGTFTTTVPPGGTECTLFILTAGATSFTITFGSGFGTVGTLATGTTAARLFTMKFHSDGTKLYEVSRTVAMPA